MAAGKVSLLIADPLRLYSEALAIALSLHPKIQVCRPRPVNGPGTLEEVERNRPDVVVLDYFMPDMQGPEIARTIRSFAPKCKIIMLAWISSSRHVQDSFRAGAVAFLGKDCSVPQLAEAVLSAHRGDEIVFASLLQRHVDQLGERIEQGKESLQRFEKLTPREVEILALLNLGRSTKEISNRLAVSLGTVRNHISSVLTKTGTNSQIEAVARARESGFLKK